MNGSREELLNLANLFCESKLIGDQQDRLQCLLRADKELQSLFIEFVQVHGQLIWDTGLISGARQNWLSEDSGTCVSCADLLSAPFVKRPSARFSRAIVSAVACVLVAVIVGILARGKNAEREVAEVLPDTTPVARSEKTFVKTNEVLVTDQTPLENRAFAPLALNGVRENDISRPMSAADIPLPRDSVSADASVTFQSAADDAEIVARIDQLLQSDWREYKVVPAKSASDHEWVRRLYLTLTGRIPSIEEASTFVRSKSLDKQTAVIDQLLADPRTAENLAVTWSNLLIGRSNSRGVDQESLFGFLKEQFEDNRPWMETVGELISAEGRSDENGATNFLLAHLNDQATPATAVTARLFLGRQVHCTQCHDHPFARGRSQQEFWSLNAFFKRTERRRVGDADSPLTDKAIWTLADTGGGGMTFYESLRGQEKAVMPEFDGQRLEADDARMSRRDVLVEFLAVDEHHQVARAMVNRTWGQFFGYGFTNPVDDLGPHNPASNPALLEYLTQAFVNSNYDLRRLMRWLTMSEAFHLSSAQSAEGIAADDPEEGGVPLFSRAYPRQMGPEQVYESLRTAIRSVSEKPIDSSIGSKHRREWVEQFVRSWGTDENDEQLEFEGDVSQALLMMNGADLQSAIPLAAARISKTVRDGSAALAETVQRLAMATLNRTPTENEERVFRNRYRVLTRSVPPDVAMKTATEDMLWAYLNSSEFISVH